MNGSNPFYCKWCKKSIEGNGWTDGPARYCNHRCFSAQSMWGFFIISLFMVPFSVAIFVYPEFMVYLFYRTSDNPIALISESIWAFLLILGIFVAIILTSIGICYSAIIGFMERKRVKILADTQRPHTQYFD